MRKSYLVKISVDAQNSGSVSVGDILNVVGNGIAFTGGIVALGFSAPVTGLVLGSIGAMAGLAGLIAGEKNWTIGTTNGGNGITELTSISFTSAQSFTPHAVTR